MKANPVVRVRNIFRRRAQRFIRTWLKACCVAFALIVMVSTNLVSADIEVHFIDVGEGEATLIVTPHKKTVLIDTGNLITGQAVYAFLQERDLPLIEHLILTHPHPDHIGGVFLLLQMMPVNAVYDNGEDLTAFNEHAPLLRWYAELVRSRNDYRALASGTTITVDEVTLTVLWPLQPPLLAGINDRSLVIMAEYRGAKFLFPGDISSKSEKEILASGIAVNAQVLKVSHHGSNDATSPEFLKAVQPAFSIISVNEPNHWGYPSDEIVSRLQAFGSQVYRTSRDGTISFTVLDSGAIKRSP